MTSNRSGMDRDSNAEPPLAEVPGLVLLRRLVTILTLTMIIGIVVITVLLWIRLSEPASVLPQLPPGITLPDGETAAAVTFARAFTVVVTASGRVLVYDPAGTLRQNVQP